MFAYLKTPKQFRNKYMNNYKKIKLEMTYAISLVFFKIYIKRDGYVQSWVT